MRKTTTTTMLIAATFTTAMTLAAPAMGSPVTGRIPAGETASLYIPFQLSQSGTLGAPLGGGRFVGLQSDSVTLSNYNRTSVGFVTFDIVFDLSDQLDAGQYIDPTSAIIEFVFNDLDFKPVNGSDVTLSEVLTMSFHRDAGGPASGTPVTIDKDNYHLYSGGAVGHETNNLELAYAICFVDDLELSAADFDAIEADAEFALRVTLATHLKYTGRYCPSTITNTPEDITNMFNMVSVPEPGTLVLLACGAIGTVARRRRQG